MSNSGAGRAETGTDSGRWRRIRFRVLFSAKLEILGSTVVVPNGQLLRPHEGKRASLAHVGCPVTKRADCFLDLLGHFSTDFFLAQTDLDNGKIIYAERSNGSKG